MRTAAPRPSTHKNNFSSYDTIDINTTVLKVLTRMLQKRAPETVAKTRLIKGDEIAGIREEYVNKQIELCEYGAIKLVMDVIACATDSMLVLQAVKLGIELLNGGNKDVQDKMLYFFYSTLPHHKQQSDLFYQNCKMYIQLEAKKIIDNRSRRVKSTEIADDVDQFGWYLIELLRLCVEGKNVEMQHLFQKKNVLSETVDFLVLVAKDAQVCSFLLLLLLRRRLLPFFFISSSFLLSRTSLGQWTTPYMVECSTSQTTCVLCAPGVSAPGAARHGRGRPHGCPPGARLPRRDSFSG